MVRNYLPANHPRCIFSYMNPTCFHRHTNTTNLGPKYYCTPSTHFQDFFVCRGRDESYVIEKPDGISQYKYLQKKYCKEPNFALPDRQLKNLYLSLTVNSRRMVLNFRDSSNLYGDLLLTKKHPSNPVASKYLNFKNTAILPLQQLLPLDSVHFDAYDSASFEVPLQEIQPLIPAETPPDEYQYYPDPLCLSRNLAAQTGVEAKVAPENSAGEKNEPEQFESTATSEKGESEASSSVVKSSNLFLIPVEDDTRENFLLKPGEILPKFLQGRTLGDSYHCPKSSSIQLGYYFFYNKHFDFNPIVHKHLEACFMGFFARGQSKAARQFAQHLVPFTKRHDIILVYKELLKAARLARYYDDVFEIVEKDMKVRKIYPDSDIYNEMIAVCVKRSAAEKAFLLFKELRAKEFPPTQSIYSNMLRCCARRHDFYGYVRDLLNDIQESEIEMSHDMYESIFIAHKKAGNVTDAYLALEEIRKQGSFRNSGLQNLYHRLLEVFAEAPRSWAINTKEYYSQYPLPFEKVRPGTETAKYLTLCFQKTFQNMRDDGLKIDSDSMYPLLNFYEGIQANEEFEQTICFMQTSNMPLSPQIRRLQMIHYCRTRRMREAMQVFHTIKRLYPSLRENDMYLTLIYGFSKVGDFSQAEAIVDEMLSFRMIPDPRHLRAFREGLLLHRKYDDLNRVLRKIHQLDGNYITKFDEVFRRRHVYPRIVPPLHHRSKPKWQKYNIDSEAENQMIEDALAEMRRR
eukprot:Sdes_comp8781_c0_seq1m156